MKSDLTRDLSLTPATMKSPHARSLPLVPNLLEIDPFEDFEFSFPCEELWWDNCDTTTATSDYFTDDEDYSATPAPTILDISFQSTFYSLSPHEEEEDEEILIPKLISMISNVAPKNIYKKRKNSMKRKRQRRKRKKMAAANIEPELRALWTNFVDVLPATDLMLSQPPPSTLPIINLSTINKQMLRKLPDVQDYPVHSASNDPAFYERNLPHSTCRDLLTSAFWKKNPFGQLPAIMTDIGPVPPPRDAVYGYVYADGQWRVKAERALVPDPGGGQRERGEGRRGQDGGARPRGRMQRWICER